VLGGTNFAGPAIVERAIARGHQVTLFNRGRTNPHLFERLELLVGDRQPDGSAGLGALHGDRRWDAVVDVWPDNAALVGPTARMLRDRTDYYFFVSSVAVHASFDRPDLDETTPLKTSEKVRRFMRLSSKDRRSMCFERAISETDSPIIENGICRVRESASTIRCRGVDEREGDIGSM
jgi:hypothetical protein